MKSTTRVLVVEDKVTDFDLAKYTIKKVLKDCEFQLVETREDFLNALQTFQPDVILSDYTLPQLDGMKALKLALKHAPLTPFIIWTGSISEDVAVECMKAGANNYILKENLKRLAPAVMHALEERQLLLERKQAEEKYQSIFENSVEGIFQSTLQGRYLNVNPAMARIYGYDSPAEMIESVTSIADQIYVDSSQRIEFLNLLNSQDIVHNFEQRNYRRDRSIIWTSTSARAVRDPKGNILYFEGFLQDITQRKITEETLQNNEKRFRALIENGLDDISLLAVDGTLLWESPSTIRNLGYSVGEFLSRNIFELMHPDDLKWTQEAFTRLVQDPGGRQNGTFRLRRSDGSWRWVEAIATNMLEEPGVNAIVINYRDITESKEAEEALRESQIRYQNLVETSHDLIWSMASEGKITFLNRAAKEIYGYEPEELLGRSFFEVMDPEHHQEDLKNFEEVLAQAKDFREFESHVRHKDGREIILSTNSIVICDDDGNVIGVTGSSRDITLRKRVEDVLKEERNLLRTLIDNVPDRIYVMDKEGRKTLSNTADWKACGGKIMEDVLGKTDFDTYSPELAEGFWQLNKAVLDSGQAVINFEEPGLDFEGNRVSILTTKIPLQDDEGNVIGLVGIGRDITERKRVELERQALLEIMQGFENTTDLRELLRLVHHSISKVIYAENFFVVLYQQNSGLFEEIYSVDQYDPPATPSKLEKSITSYVFRSGEPLLLTQERFNELVAQGKVVLVGTDSASWLGAPLKTSGRIIGVIAIQDYENVNRYSERDKDFLASIATQIALAIEHRQAGEALQESEEHYRTIFEGVQDAIFVESVDGEILMVNQRACEMFGYSQAEFLTKRVTDIVPPGHLMLTADGKDIPLSTEPRETINQRANGETFPVEISGRLQEINGETVLLVVVRDITERKQAEEALHKSEALYRRAIEVAGAVPYYETYYNEGRSIKYEFIGEGIRQITGYGPEEFNEQLWDSLVEDVNLVGDLAGYSLEEGLQLVRRGDNTNWKCEHRLRDRDGKIHWIFEAAVELRDENGVSYGSIGTYQDITERKQAENELRESEERFSSAFEYASIGVALVTVEGRWLRVNRALCDLVGYSEEELLTKTFQDITHPDDLDTDLNYVRQLLAGEINSYKMEKRYFHKLGSIVWVLLSVSLVRDDQGKPLYFISQIQDVTEHKRAEEAEHEQRALAEALRDTAETLSSTLEYGEVLDHILEVAGRVVPHDAATIMLIDGESAHVVRSSGYDTRIPDFDVMGIELPLAETNNLRQMLATGQTVVVYDTYTYPGWKRLRETDWVRSSVGAPISVYGKVIGFILLDSQTIGFFTPVHAERLEAFANQAALAIHNAHLLQQAQEEIVVRKQAEEALRESERRYRALFEDTPIAIWEEDFSEVKQYLDSLRQKGVTDFREYFSTYPDAITLCADKIRVLGVNKATLQMYHANSKDDLLEKVNRGLSKSEIEYLREAFIGIAEQKTSYTWEGTDETTAGETTKINVSASVTPGYENDYSRVIVTITVTDITERKRAERALQESEEKYRKLAEQIPAAVYVDLADDSRKTLYISPGIERILGYSPQDWLEKPELCSSIIYPEDFARVSNETAIAEAQGQFSLDYRFVAKDGQIIWVRDEAVLLGGEDGQPRYWQGLIMDITEHKQAEEELRASEERFRQLADNIEEAFWMTDAITDEGIYISPAAEVIWERPIKSLTSEATPFIDTVHPEDQAAILWAIEKEKHGEKVEIEYRILRPNGSVRWVWDRAFPIFDETGKVKRIAGITADVTERRESEIALLKSQSRYRELFDSSPIGIWEEDYSLVKTQIDHLLESGVTNLKEYLSGHPEEVTKLASLVKITDANKAALELYKIDQNEVVLKELSQILSQDALDHFQEEILGLLSPSRRFTWEGTDKMMNGSQIEVIVNGSIPHGYEEDWSKVIVSVSNVTERRQAQQQLRKLSRAVEQSGSTIVITDPAGSIEYVNPKFTEVTGYAPEEVIGHNPRILKSGFTPNEDYKQLWQRITAGKVWHGELLNKKKNGDLFWEYVTISPILGERGEITHFVGVKEDISRRKQDEIEIRRRANEFAALYETARDLATQYNLPTLLNTISERARALLRSSGGGIYLYDEARGDLEMALAVGSSVPTGARLKMNEGMAGRVAQSRQLLTVDDYRTWEGRSLQYEAIPFRAVLQVPMLYGGQLIGVLSVNEIGESERKYTESDAHLLSLFAEYAASAVHAARLLQETRRHAEETSALLQTSLALTNLDLKSTLQTIGNSAKALFAADGCRVFLMEPDGQSLRCVLALQENMAVFSNLRIKAGQGVTGAVAASGQAEIVNEMQNDPRSVQVPGTQENEPEAIMFAPLKERDHTIGVLSIRRAGTEQPFQPADLELLEAFASMAASAVSNARLFEETQRRLAELEALYENGLAVGQLLESSEIGSRLINTFTRYLQWHHVTIRLKKGESDGLELVAFNLPGLEEKKRADAEQHFAALINKVGQGLSGWVIQTGLPFRTGNVRSHPQYIDMHASIRSGLYMPLKVGEQVIGVISVESEVPDAFTEQDERLLATLANQAAVAFENARLYETAQKELLERKRTEEALRASEVHYRELADSITDILFELDQNLRYTHWNKASEMFSGLSAEDTIGKSMQEVYGVSDEQARREEIYKSVLKERRARTFETETLAKGQKRALEINAYPSARGVSVVAKDVTERKQSELIMQKRFELMEFSAHHSLDELMQNTADKVSELTGSPIGFIHFMEEDQTTLGVQTWSTHTLQMFHVPASEGMHLSLDQAGVWAEAARQRRPLIQNDYESLFKRKGLPQGHVLIEREIVIPIIRNERIMAIIGIANKPQDYTQDDLEIAERLADYAWDIAERKQMETALKAERNQLAQRVDERTADLSRANSNLARALRVKDEFLANMSHELRTPLNAILGLSESLGEQIAGPLNEKQQKYIATISESGHHLLSLINDILDLAKIDAGQITLDINKVDIRSVCQASLRMIKQLAQKKNQEVSLEIDEGLALMWADERRLKQMIVNLLGNAVKFTPENGKLGLEVHGDEEANKISFTVWDEGIGIKQEDLARLFQPFVQLDSGLARETTGTGLGLALVAQMARLHGGSIMADSEPDKGSRFMIVLPWEPALAVDAVTRMKITGKFHAIKVDEKNKPTILLVEDTKEVTMMVKDYLELAGYKIMTAQDGVDAIIQAKLVRPDLILMDVQMPRMDGLEAARKLRSEPDFRYTPIIALTALAMPSDRERCLQAGMDEYISKPINLKALLKMIQGCLFDDQEVKSR